jgi:hypothetical protein
LAGAQERQKPAPPEPFEWSATRRLTWSDYLGRPDMMSQASALTVYVMAIEHGCSGEVFSFRVAVMFQPQRSWVKPALLARGGASVLEHEQAHFDLGEVQARRLRRAFKSVKDPCEVPATEFNELASKYIIEDAERQQRYDQETIYGLDRGRQGLWQDDIRKQLKELAAFVH